MKIAFCILHFTLFIFFVSCATKTTPVFVTIKSPKIKISDEGFLKEGFGYKEIIIYKAGNMPVKFILKNNKICINNECINKYFFMKKYFNGYKKDFFDRILSKKPLSIKIYKKTKNGFIQKSKTIFYKVDENSILFKDKTRNFLIYIKFLKDKND